MATYTGVQFFRGHGVYIYTQTHTTILRLCGFCPGQPGWAGTKRNIHPPTPIVVIKYPYLPPPSTTIHGILPIQSIKCFVFKENAFLMFLKYFFALNVRNNRGLDQQKRK